VARQDRVRIGQEPMRGEVSRVGVNRFPSFHKRKLLEAQIAVDAREARAAGARSESSCNRER
jgi:hypothetical protein